MALTTRAIVLGTTAIAIGAVTLMGAGLHLSAGSSLLRNNTNSPKELVDEVWQVIDHNYVDGTFNQKDWQAIRRQYLDRNYANKQEAYNAIREMLKTLDDPYTRFMDPTEFKNMRIDTSGELTGVGIQLAADETTKKLTVVAPIEDSPAFKAGIRSKDMIVKIDEQSTEGMDVNKAVTLIRGPVGTQVKLTIQRGSQSLTFDLRRDKIEIHPVRASVQAGSMGNVGYVRLVQFSAPAVREMRDAIKKLEGQGVTGYVLDLRSNPGGLLEASVEIARMWMKEGGIVVTVDRQGGDDRRSANGSALTDKPLVVLVDGGSASASEILAGALQDNKRAKIIGTRTFGKGLVQSVRELSADGDESGLAVTIAKYLTPNRRDINKHGIDPDVEIKLTEEQQKFLSQEREKIGTPSDPQFAKALQILGQEITAKRAEIPAASKPK
ncbi:MAG: S41 family peptidase [Synechococcales bacterium]|nr:S41 family peptidase [Synechococcales bacterium]